MNRGLRGRIDLADVARAGRDAMVPLAQVRGILLNCEIENGSHRVCGNADRLMQLCINLLANALKFTDRGGHVTIRVHRRPNRELLQVCDNGEGIAPDQLRRVFEPFVTGARAGGLGLGLAIVKDIAAEHGGWVAARSVGRAMGTMVSVCLPASEQGAAFRRA